MGEFAGSLLPPDLLSLFRADVPGVPVSVMCSVKAGFTHVTISLQLEEEVMSSDQLALICAAALLENYKAWGGAKTQIWVSCPHYFTA